MRLNKTMLAALIPILSLVATSTYASDTDNNSLNFDQNVNPGLYPPLSTGEASPWQDDSNLSKPDGSAKGNPWGAAPAVTAIPKSYGAPVATVNPYYGYRGQQTQTPYYYPPQQGYGYAPPVYGYAPPAYGYAPNNQQAYGNYGGPFNSMPWGNMPFNGNMPFSNGNMPFSNGNMPFSNGGNNPFGFSMPWSF